MVNVVVNDDDWEGDTYYWGNHQSPRTNCNYCTHKKKMQKEKKSCQMAKKFF